LSSRLASLLIRDRVVAPDVATAAMRRQVLYGGALDTVLLEMDALDEPTLWRYLSEATGLGIPDPDLVETPRPEAAAIFDITRADTCNAVPVAVAGGGKTLRVLCAEPLAVAALEQAERDLGLVIERFIVPEVRLRALREAVYRRPMSSRFIALLGRMLGAETVRRWASPAAQIHKPPAFQPEPQPEPARTPTPAPAEPTESPAAASALPMPPAPLLVPAAVSRIKEATTRDEVFAALADAVAIRMSFVVVMSVKGAGTARVAQGRAARAAETVDPAKVASLSLPLGPASPFQMVSDFGAPYVGALGAGEVAGAFQAFVGRLAAPGAVIIPVMLRSRAVCLFYADRGDAPPDPEDAPTLMGYARTAAAALERLILRTKAESGSETETPPPEPISSPEPQPTPALTPSSTPTPQAAATPDVAPELPPSAAALETDNAGAGVHPASANDPLTPMAPVPTPAPRPVVPAASPPPPPAVVAEDRRSSAVDALLDAYQADPDGAAGEAAAAAILRAADVSAVLERISRRLLDGHALPEAAMLRLVAKFGDAALPVVRPLLTSADPAWRRRAAEMLGTLGVRGAEETLVRLTDDADTAVRTAALRALRRCPDHPYVKDLAARLRATVTDATPHPAAAAAAALGELRDRDAVPTLAQHLKADEPHLAIAAHRALCAITKQDFGDSRWRWASWWKRSRDRSRIEWLLEGLAHREPELRFSASQELRHLTGQYFGYHFDLPKREREEARQRWVDWWENTGRARFGGRF